MHRAAHSGANSRSASRFLLTAGVFLVCAFTVHAQINSNSSYLNAAAQAYESAAAQCQNPAGAACMRQFANYERCVAGGGSCGNAPTCSTSCVGAGAGSGAGFMTVNPAMSAAQNKVQQMDNVVNMGISLFEMFHKSPPNPQPDAAPAPDPEAAAAAAAAAQQQLINAQAADLLNSANALLPAQPDVPAAAPALPDLNATLDNLLDSGPPADTSTSAITSLLDGDSSPPDAGTTPDSPTAPAADPTATISNLLSSDNSPGANNYDTSAAGIPSQPPADQAVPSDIVPPDPATNAALQQSVDQSDPSVGTSLAQSLQGSGPNTNDGLNSLISSQNTLASNTSNDPVMQWATECNGSFTCIPTAAPGDDPDTAANKVFGQSIVGMNDLIKSVAGGPVAWAKGLYNYGTKMVNQMGADLGLANASIANPDATPSPENSQ